MTSALLIMCDSLSIAFFASANICFCFENAFINVSVSQLPYLSTTLVTAARVGVMTGVAVYLAE